MLGGAGIALFGMVAASGIRTLTKVKFNNKNVLIVAISVGVALLPTVAPTIYDQFPQWFTLIFDSGISAGAITAILLNLLLNTEQMREARLTDPSIGASDAVRGPAAAALVHPEAEGTGLIPTQVLSDELAAEQTGDGLPVDVSRIELAEDDPKASAARSLSGTRRRDASSLAESSARLRRSRVCWWRGSEQRPSQTFSGIAPHFAIAMRVEPLTHTTGGQSGRAVSTKFISDHGKCLQTPVVCRAAGRSATSPRTLRWPNQRTWIGARGGRAATRTREGRARRRGRQPHRRA